LQKTACAYLFKKKICDFQKMTVFNKKKLKMALFAKNVTAIFWKIKFFKNRYAQAVFLQKSYNLILYRFVKFYNFPVSRSQDLIYQDANYTV
jgi:hypothetical protein